MLGDAGARRPGMPDFPDPESSARITERGPEFNGAWTGPAEAAFCLKSGLSGRRWSVQPRGIEEMLAQSRRPIRTQSWVLRKSRNADRKPDADCGQRHGKGEGGKVGEHAVAEIVGLVARSLKMRQVISFMRAVLRRGRPGGCAEVRGRNLSTRCSSSEVMGRWVFNAAGPTFP